tara:strand:+ start:4865 stop:5272 length:408 start_codon:yes stop_codon:yes gene_type:complete
MKTINTFILFTLVLFQSCQSQEKMNTTSLNYFAQTRGFIYAIHLKNNELELNNNTHIKKITLTTNQKKEINELLLKIDFKKIENNISIQDLAVDKAIKGTFELNFKAEDYSFDFNHNNLPENIQQLITHLEEFTQ